MAESGPSMGRRSAFLAIGFDWIQSAGSRTRLRSGSTDSQRKFRVGRTANLIIVSIMALMFGGCSTCVFTSRAKDEIWLLRQSELLFEPLVRQGASWGAVVVDAATGEVILQKNPNRHFIPASNMKLVTTAAALELLGPLHTFLSELYLRESILHQENDRAVSDLVVVGGGDPSLGSEELKNGDEAVFHDWCDSLAKRGITELAGDILGCGLLFENPMPGPCWGWDDLAFGFSALPAGLCYHDNQVDITLAPGAEEGLPCEMLPGLGFRGLDLICEVGTSAPGSRRALRLSRVPGSWRMTLSGSLPVDDGSVHLSVAHPNPQLMAADVFRDILIESGIEVLGVAGNGCSTEARGLRVASHVSPSLKELIAIINRESKNLWAEQLLLIVGLEESGIGTREAGVGAVERVLDGFGIPGAGFRMFDGSGLSRLNLASPSFLSALLLHTVNRFWAEEFRNSLPVSGKSGTLKSRMQGTIAEGRIRAKTGSMQGVRALSGFAQASGGRNLVFSVMINGYPGAGTALDAALDRFCVLLVLLGV